MAEQDQSQIESLRGQVESLKADLALLHSRLDILVNTPARLTNYLDQNSKDILNRVAQQNYKQVTTLVTAGFKLLPQSSYIKVTATASRTSDTTTAIINGSWYGQPLIIEGSDNTNTVIIKDAANTQLAGDCTLGIYDTLSLMWNGTYWIELCRSNN